MEPLTILRCDAVVQASFFLQDAAGLSNRTDEDSSVNTVFEILVEPAADASFGYAWKPLSEVIHDDGLDLPSGQSLFQINGSTPCCIPISDRIYADINRTRDDFAKEDKTWILTSSPVSGQLMGMCSSNTEQNGTSVPFAIFSYYGQIYAATEAEIMDPSTSPMALVIESYHDKDISTAVQAGLGMGVQGDPGKSQRPFSSLQTCIHGT